MKASNTYLLLAIAAVFCWISAQSLLSEYHPARGNGKLAERQPVVIDTDVGSDFDDGVAIAFAAQSSYLDVKLIVTCTDNTTARAKIVAKLLTLYGHDDIPIGIGVKNSNKTAHTLFDWAKDFDLSSYKGGVFTDGVGTMAEVILNSTSVIDIIAIGPMTNFPELLDRYPGVVKKARIRAMAGSILNPIPEYNVKMCPSCMSRLLQAGWNVAITPLDTCGQATLTPVLMEKLLASTNAVSLGIANSLVYFCIANPYMNCELKVTTPVFFDTVAVLLTFPIADDYVIFKELNITVTEDGYTKVDNTTGSPTDVALYWQENVGLDNFRLYLTEILSIRN